jgi:hypothetical protein
VRPAIFTQDDLAAIHEARAERAVERVATTEPCPICRQPIAPGWLYTRDAKGRPVHIGPCPTPGRFTAARIEFEERP